MVFEARTGGETYSFDEPVLFATLGDNNWKGSYILNGQQVDVEVTDFMPNPTEQMVDDDYGLPTVKVVIGGANGREEYYVQKGQRSRIRGTVFNFRDTEEPLAFNIKYEDSQLFFKAPTTFSETVMATQTKSELSAHEYHPLKLRSLYASGGQSFVFGLFSPNASVELTSSDQKMQSTSMGGLKMKVSSNGQVEEQYIFGAKGVEGRPRVFSMGNLQLAISYGAKRIELPFALRLRDFQLEKYPGTNSASSYASEVTLIDPRIGLNEDKRIFMNNILDYEGYRFFQSSFDQDELGTYLSVNFDWWGTWISYLGYAILTIGMFLTFFSKKSRFQQLARNLKNAEKLRQPVTAIFVGLLMAFSGPIMANTTAIGEMTPININHSEKFGQLVMQDHRGRMKPMNTYASEILRKLSRKESLYGMTAEQIVLGIVSNPKEWHQVPLIKTGKHEKTKKILPSPKQGDLLSYSDFFDKDGKYILREHVRAAYNTDKKDRGVFEKEMMKLDEKVNIYNMVFTGSFMRLFPIPNDPNNTWESPNEGNHAGHNHGSENNFAKKFFAAYIPTLQTSLV